MKIKSDDFLVREGKKPDLDAWPTRVKPYYTSKKHYMERLEEQHEELRSAQEILYAHDRYALLVVFQAMDTAGKDGAIKHVMSGVNPQGCQVYSFKHPGPEELEHDFLWRAARRLPERGQIGIFNRSHYEEVLIVRTHPELLRSQQLPDDGGGKSVWKSRYQSIRDFESHLHRNGTRIVKFYLHLSKEEQRQRLLARIDDPAKNWKFKVGDLTERKLWKDYMKAYEACLGATSTREAPWYAVPADDKHNARLIIAHILVATLKSLKMSYPEVDAKGLKELKQARALLAGD
jgi:PPK2 family polyphosphate:nucleotide phosphotransferase